MSPCSHHPREYGLKLLFLKTEVEKSGIGVNGANLIHLKLLFML